MPKPRPAPADLAASRSGRPVTLSEVARAAGVSTMTASRALRNAPRCSPQTREKVRRTAERLGYKPDPLISIYQARVRSRKVASFQATLAWLDDFPEPGWHKRSPSDRLMWEGARAHASALGYKLDELRITDIPGSPAERVKKIERMLEARGVPGVIIPSVYDSRIAAEEWTRTAVACLGEHAVRLKSHPGARGIDHDLYDHAHPDFFANVRIACEHLRAQGYRRVGFALSGWSDRGTGGEYAGAYLRAQQDWPETERIPICAIPILDDITGAVPDYRRWFADWKPDAILCNHGGFLRLAEACGKRVPHDLGVAHLWLAEDVAGWTGIDPRLPQIGAAAVDLILGQLMRNQRGRPEHPRSLRFTGDWREGATTAWRTRPQS